MTLSYTEIVNEIKRLSFEEKEELKSLLENYLAEESRKEKEIAKNHVQSLEELRNESLKFSSNINELKQSLN